MEIARTDTRPREVHSIIPETSPADPFPTAIRAALRREMPVSAEVAVEVAPKPYTEVNRVAPLFDAAPVPAAITPAAAREKPVSTVLVALYHGATWV